MHYCCDCCYGKEIINVKHVGLQFKTGYECQFVLYSVLKLGVGYADDISM